MARNRGLWRTGYALPVLVAMAGCVSAKYIQTGAAYPARASDCTIEVVSAGLPNREFEESGIVEGEGTFWKADLQDVIPRLREEACLVGGDALILLSANKYADGHGDGVDEAELYAVATVIRWSEG